MRHCYFLMMIVVISFTDELASIMKKLSLEKYNPIFEEQEVIL